MATAEPMEGALEDLPGSDLGRCAKISAKGAARFLADGYLGVACGVKMLNIEASDPSMPEDDDEPP